MTILERVREIRKLFGKEKDKWLTPEELAYVDELCDIAERQARRLVEAEVFVKEWIVLDCWNHKTPPCGTCVGCRARAWLGGK